MLRIKKFRRPKFLTRNIVLLSFVSMATDIASEMVYPIIPLYMASLGYGAATIGLLEGFANAVTGLSQGWFGYWSDKIRKPEWFVRAGYGLSAISKPMLAVFSGVYAWLFGARVLDRFGKAVRSASRDAILANDSTPENRGKVFGFHRSLDTLGATIGPVIAVLILFMADGSYKLLFLIAAIPGAISTYLTFRVKPGQYAPKTPKRRPPGLHAFKEFFASSSLGYRRILCGYLLLGVVNGSDFFLLLRARELGMSELTIVLVYVLYNFVYTLVAFPMGAMSDRFGFRKVYIAGLVVFATVYGVMANDISLPVLIGLFAIYGIFTAAGDAVSKAWLTKHINSDAQATGMGLYLTLNSLAFLFATAGTGLLWNYAGSAVTFSVVALCSLVALLYFVFVRIPEADKH